MSDNASNPWSSVESPQGVPSYGPADALRPMVAAPRLDDRGRYEGPSRLAPYAMSRMAPAFGLVDAAKAIEDADSMLATVTGGKLAVIAEQMRMLKSQAEALLERARRDAELHRAECSFEKKPGGTYHLYRRHVDGELWFSLLGPSEWTRPPPQSFEGTYRLEADMSFTRLDSGELSRAAEETDAMRVLLLKSIDTALKP